MAATLSICLLAVSYKTDYLDRFQDALSFILHPLLLTVNTPSQSLGWVSDKTMGRSALIEENNTLKADALMLKAKLQKFDAIEKENTRLHSLLESSFEIGEQFIAASLLSVNTNKNSQQVVIDKGSRFGLFLGQAALNEDGIVGQITAARPLTSDVILITDPSHAIPVEINRTGLRTIAIGTGLKNSLSLPYLPLNADIKAGDLLTSSGLGAVFPKGYPVATISSFELSGGKAFMHASATTIADIDKTHELLLVWSRRDPIPLLPGTPKTAKTDAANAL